jgi:hypothetical protein
MDITDICKTLRAALFKKQPSEQPKDTPPHTGG